MENLVGPVIISVVEHHPTTMERQVTHRGDEPSLAKNGLGDGALQLFLHTHSWIYTYCVILLYI